MAKKYKSVRFEQGAYNNLLAKKLRMEAEAQKKLGIPVKIPMSRILNSVTKNPLFLDDRELISLTRKKRKNVIY